VKIFETNHLTTEYFIYSKLGNITVLSAVFIRQSVLCLSERKQSEFGIWTLNVPT